MFKLSPARVVGTVIVLAVILACFGSFYTVNQGERGVITRFGKVISTAEPGLGFKLPFVETVNSISVQQHTQQYDKLQAYSNDQQPADMRVSVNYHVTDPAKLFAEFGTIDNALIRIIDRKVPQDLKTVFGQYTASSVIRERAKFNVDVSNAIMTDVTGEGVIAIDSVQVENVDFSEAYEQAVEQRMLAEVAVQKINQQAAQAEAQAKVTVTNAKAQADAKVAEAQAEAQATRLRGEAEAAAIKARGDALKENPGLVGLTAAERWDGRLPTTMVPGGATPFVSIPTGP